MRRRGFGILAAALVCLAWAVAPLESAETVALAKVLTNFCGQQSDETMRLFGTALLNRVGKEEYGDTLGQVLRGFGSSFWYDSRSLECARRLVAGKTGYNAAPEEVVHAVHKDADQSAYAELDFWRISGDYVFYYRS